MPKKARNEILLYTLPITRQAAVYVSHPFAWIYIVILEGPAHSLARAAWTGIANFRPLPSRLGSVGHDHTMTRSQEVAEQISQYFS